MKDTGLVKSSAVPSVGASLTLNPPPRSFPTRLKGARSGLWACLAAGLQAGAEHGNDGLFFLACLQGMERQVLMAKGWQVYAAAAHFAKLDWGILKNAMYPPNEFDLISFALLRPAGGQ